MSLLHKLFAIITGLPDIIRVITETSVLEFVLCLCATRRYLEIDVGGIKRAKEERGCCMFKNNEERIRFTK